MTGYEFIKYLHIGCVVLSFTGFMIRSLYLLFRPEKLSQAWLKYPPHLVETGLLLSALAMLPMLGQYPFVDHWLTAKLVAMFLYIGFAGYALHSARSMATKLTFVLLSLSLFIYIIGAALHHHAGSWFS